MVGSPLGSMILFFLVDFTHYGSSPAPLLGVTMGSPVVMVIHDDWMRTGVPDDLVLNYHFRHFGDRTSFFWGTKF